MCSTGKFTVRREHNSKLILTMPSGAKTIGNTDGRLYLIKLLLFIVLMVMQARLKINILLTSKEFVGTIYCMGQCAARSSFLKK